MTERTPLYAQHRAAGAKLVPFAGWEMPLHYGSQLDEHRLVRTYAGAFDVSHMGVVDIAGAQAGEFLRYLLANDVARLVPGKALYSCLLDPDGGILDDLICYLRADGSYRLVVNAGTREQDLAWIERQARDFEVAIMPRPELAMIAVQGPQASELALPLLPDPLREPAARLAPFHAAEAEGWFVGRTGYTGEDGFELVLPAAAAVEFWQQLLSAGVVPCGLGARDSLRLEAGLNLYGQDMDRSTTPLESNLAWTVAWEPAARDFIGRAALQRQREQGVPRRLVGVVLPQRGGVLRAHQTIHIGEQTGEITSGTYSTCLGCSIGLARIPANAQGPCEVEIRGRRWPVQIVRPPFVRHGKSLIEIQ